MRKIQLEKRFHSTNTHTHTHLTVGECVDSLLDVTNNLIHSSLGAPTLDRKRVKNQGEREREREEREKKKIDR